MTRTLLLADDSVTIQKVVELTFLDEDVRVVSVGNGAEAIERAAEVSPDVVLADVHMPGADGYAVCEAIRQRAPETPVLLLVGTFEIFDSARAEQVGASGHLKKPFDSQELMRRVHQLLQAAPPAMAPVATLETAPVEELEPEPAADSGPGETWSFEPVEEEAVETEAPAEEEPIALAASEPEAAEEAAVEPASAPAEPVPAPVATVAEPIVAGPLSDDDVDRIARRLLELGGDRVLREVAWEVVPDLAEVLLKARIRELEASVE